MDRPRLGAPVSPPQFAPNPDTNEENGFEIKNTISQDKSEAGGVVDDSLANFYAEKENQTWALKSFGDRDETASRIPSSSHDGLPPGLMPPPPPNQSIPHPLPTPITKPSQPPSLPQDSTLLETIFSGSLDDIDEEVNEESQPTVVTGSTSAQKSNGVTALEVKQKQLTNPDSETSPNSGNTSLNSDLVRHFLKTIAKLERENKLLRAHFHQPVQKTSKTQKEEPQIGLKRPEEPTVEESVIYETFHAVKFEEGYSEQKWCYFQDVPRMFKGDSKSDQLRGLHEVENLTRYLEKHPHVAFAHVCEYSPTEYKSKFGQASFEYRSFRLVEDAPPAEPSNHRICLGPQVLQALKSIMESNSETFEGCDEENIGSFHAEPYLFFFVHNQNFLDFVDSSLLEEKDRSAVKLLCNWLESNFGADWKEANELLLRGKINIKHYPKLFRPNDIVIEVDDAGVARAYCSFDWDDDNFTKTFYYTYHWTFDGTFSKTGMNFPLDGKGKIKLKNRKKELDEITEVDITSLQMYPLRYSKQEGLFEKLMARGEKFWSCRQKKLMCYKEIGSDDILESECRVMIDYETLQLMHPKNSVFQGLTGIESISADAGELPDEDEYRNFFALLPPYIHGFDLKDKTWRRLRVDRLTNVTWNKDAFNMLVVPKETKEMIQAMVAAQSQKLSTAPDIIAGKGNGLLILLHGGPGTGKTLTAESIAELQERPLYRITCGDVGLEPDQVEKYLDVALRLGRAWGCVVLLDEADVFIEERSLMDLKRNALISVFLRVLEYYDGILILTSNRVGIFDEAFKSRIQLALRYPSLDDGQRLEIWRNFAYMLKKNNQMVDVDDLEMNLAVLARVQINGRQIRNVVTMARHLAKFRKQRMRYEHVQHAIATVTEFDGYLKEVKGCEDDDWARADKIR